MAEAKTKTYPYIVLIPSLAAEGITYRLAGEFEGRAPEQAVEAALEDNAVPIAEGEDGLTLGVVAVPASKWYVVEGEGERRVDWKLTRGGGDTGSGAEPTETPTPPPVAETDEEGLKVL